jgi:hypothetical protein
MSNIDLIKRAVTQCVQRACHGRSRSDMDGARCDVELRGSRGALRDYAAALAALHGRELVEGLKFTAPISICTDAAVKTQGRLVRVNGP